MPIARALSVTLVFSALAVPLSCKNGADSETPGLTVLSEDPCSIVYLLVPSSLPVEQILTGMKGSPISAAELHLSSEQISSEAEIRLAEGEDMIIPRNSDWVVDRGITIEAAGPTVNIESTPLLDPAGPVKVTIPVTLKEPLLDTEEYCVFYKTFEKKGGERFNLGVIRSAELEIEGESIAFDATSFGAFQAAVISKDAETKTGTTREMLCAKVQQCLDASRGALDTSFGDGGAIDVGAKFYERVAKILVDEDGKIVVSSGAALLRFLPDMELDESFGDRGKLALEEKIGPTQMVLDGEGRIVMLFKGDNPSEDKIVRLFL